MDHYKQTSKTITCPVCRGTQARVLWEVNSEQAAQHFVLREKAPERFRALVAHIEHLWGRDLCEVAECDQCGFCYSNPYRAGDKRFYDLAYERHNQSYPKWKWEFEATYAELAKTAQRSWLLLEVGAGNGAFVEKVAENLVPPQNILCTEFSDFGREKIGKLGIQCLAVDVRELAGSQYREQFDAVCMFQVLEHLDEPDAIFGHLNRLMKPGGRLFIAVPNPHRIEFNELNGALLDMPPNHIGRWNRSCFEEIGRRTGFRVEDFRVEDPGFRALAVQFIVYRFLRNSQRSGSIENRIESIRNHALHTPARALGVALNSVFALPALFRIDKKQGDSQWVHLVSQQT
jgi:SAM-dependent methyltransferase